MSSDTAQTPASAPPRFKPLVFVLVAAVLVAAGVTVWRSDCA